MKYVTKPIKIITPVLWPLGYEKPELCNNWFSGLITLVRVFMIATSKRFPPTAVKRSRLLSLCFFIKRKIAVIIAAIVIINVSKLMEMAFAIRIAVSLWKFIIQRLTATSIG